MLLALIKGYATGRGGSYGGCATGQGGLECSIAPRAVTKGRQLSSVRR